MPSINKCFALFFLTLSASALTTPHAIRNVNHHRAVAVALGEKTVHEPSVFPLGTRAAKTVRRRSNNGRCITKSATSSSTPAAAVSSPVANLKGAPPTTTTSDRSSSKSTPTPKSSHTASSVKHASSAGTSGGGSQPSFMAGQHTGDATYYGAGLGACGITNTDSDYIAAASHIIFDSYPGYNGANPNQNPMCGKKVIASYQGKSVTVILTDRCVGCAEDDLDFTPTAFSQLADQALGRLHGMTWKWA